MRGNMSDDSFDDGEDEQPSMGGEPFAPREPQPFYPREQKQQQHQPQSQPQSQPQHFQPRQQHMPPPTSDADVDRLPSFITGGQPAPQPQQQAQAPTNPTAMAMVMTAASPIASRCIGAGAVTAADRATMVGRATTIRPRRRARHSSTIKRDQLVPFGAAG